MIFQTSMIMFHVNLQGCSLYNLQEGRDFLFFSLISSRRLPPCRFRTFFDYPTWAKTSKNAKISFRQVDQKRHHWPKNTTWKFSGWTSYFWTSCLWEWKRHPSLPKSSKCLLRRCLDPQMPFQFGVLNTYSQGTVFGRLEIWKSCT